MVCKMMVVMVLIMFVFSRVLFRKKEKDQSVKITLWPFHKILHFSISRKHVVKKTGKRFKTNLKLLNALMGLENFFCKSQKKNLHPKITE